jgi:hypothetical protein
VLQEERDLLGRGELGRHDQVALVLAVLVVDHDHDLAAADGRHRLVDRRERLHASVFQVSRRSTYLAVDVDLQVDARTGDPSCAGS